ncbi:unnamed protein product [Lepidochelys olivacea]
MGNPSSVESLMLYHQHTCRMQHFGSSPSADDFPAGNQAVSYCPSNKCGRMRRTLKAWYWIIMLVLAVFSEAAFCRRGGGRRSGGGGSGKNGGGSGGRRGGFQALPKSSSSQSKESSPRGGVKMAGAAAAGAAIGYGLGALGRSRHSRVGHGASGGRQVPLSGQGHSNWSHPLTEGEFYNRAPKDAEGLTALLLSPIGCCLSILLRG